MIESRPNPSDEPPSPDLSGIVRLFKSIEPVRVVEEPIPEPVLNEPVENEPLFSEVEEPCCEEPINFPETIAFIDEVLSDSDAVRVSPPPAINSHCETGNESPRIVVHSLISRFENLNNR